ncbi:MAG TPA: lmo0937 family membrane protein [Mucilaginibacter sp.]|nr:lmo0937 family membrane protein [Mucilaginibacter sp.]
MNSILYIVAVVLVIGWALGVFVYSLTGLIHVLLVIAIIALILGVIRRPTAI